MTKWILSVGFDLAVIALWLYLDHAAQREDYSILLALAAQEGELALMADRGYALNQDGEFSWVGGREA